MSLRYALLAILTARPKTGYDVSKGFHSSVGHVWHAPDSQVYPELRRMEQDGLLESKDIPWGTRGKKKLYSVTEAGITDFRTWLETPFDYSLTRDPLALKTAYMEWGNPQGLLTQLDEHIAFHQSLITQWSATIAGLEAQTDEILRDRLGASEEREWGLIAGYKILAYKGLVARATAEVKWAKEAKKESAKLEERFGSNISTRTATAPLRSIDEHEEG
ncbi:DNA-binding PadR family transcriptional regulator [Neomicrococcus aestuarii]|uniref:DNA-binding PadR family transcriptional regulator n=1 Tax=Neomicrococcus aestuarii TaxID=556325 RepID=A0A7W8TUR2_9MICC|nr:helix-turn-helix transcriptional regulator [Neomicrococcus aestuarii]MBB5513194.1 DNA-binding PadR family transcriptional regulator [Neomicrococcus aestuarii]